MQIDGKPYKRDGFITRVEATVGLPSLEAVGPTNQGHVWHLTFINASDKDQFVGAGDFSIGSHRALVSGLRTSKQVLRLHWAPYHVPMSAVVADIERIAGVRVVSATYEQQAVTSPMPTSGAAHTICTLVRTVVIESATPAAIPHIVSWRHGGANGQCLVTARGRPIVCLRCFLPNHFRRNCHSIKCGRCRKWGTHETDACTATLSYASQTVVDSSPTEGDLAEEDMDITSAGATDQAPTAAAAAAAAGRDAAAPTPPVPPPVANSTAAGNVAPPSAVVLDAAGSAGTSLTGSTANNDVTVSASPKPPPTSSQAGAGVTPPPPSAGGLDAARSAGRPPSGSDTVRDVTKSTSSTPPPPSAKRAGSVSSSSSSSSAAFAASARSSGLPQTGSGGARSAKEKSTPVAVGAKTAGSAPPVVTKSTSARGGKTTAADAAKTRRASTAAAAAHDPPGANRCHSSLTGRPSAASPGGAGATRVDPLLVGSSPAVAREVVGATSADLLLVVRQPADSGQVVAAARVDPVLVGSSPAVAPQTVGAARADQQLVVRQSADVGQVVGAAHAAPLPVGRVPTTAAADVAGAAASLIGRPSVVQEMSDSQLIAACGLVASTDANQHLAASAVPDDVTDSQLVRADQHSTLNATASAFTPRTAPVPATVDVDFHALLRDEAASSDEDIPSMAWSSLGVDALPETQGTDVIDMFISPPVDPSVWPEYHIYQTGSPAAQPPPPPATRLPQPAASADRKRSHQLVSSDASSVSTSSSSSSAGKHHKSGAGKRRNRRDREAELTASNATADDFRSSDRKPQQSRR
jgi:hypothetical protein